MAFTNLFPQAEDTKTSYRRVWVRLKIEYFLKNFVGVAGAELLRIRNPTLGQNTHVSMHGNKSSPAGGARLFLVADQNPADIALDTRLSRVSPTVVTTPEGADEELAVENTIDLVITLNGRTTNLVGTGNGSLVTFNATLNNLPVAKLTRVFLDLDRIDNLSVTGAGQPKTITADGLTGTINLNTGAIALTFTTAPANGALISAEFDGAVEKVFPGDPDDYDLRRQSL